MTQSSQDKKTRTIGPFSIQNWLILLSICLAVYFVNLGGARVLTSHEVDASGGARQMIAEGDWLIPKIGDHSWLEKPPLLHWLIALLIILFGKADEFVARLPLAVAGSILALLMAATIARWKGEKAGLAGGFIQCTSWYMMTYSRLAEADMLLACMVVSAIVVFIHLQGIGLPRPSPRPHLLALVFWIIIGLTNLCKGPLFGAAMALMPCVAWLLWRRESTAWKRMWSPAGLILGFLIAVAWPALVLMKEPSAFELWFAHTVGRAKGDIGYGKPWWYYLQVPPGRLMPWTLLTLFGAVPSLKRMWLDRDSADRFTWLWALVPIFVLSLSYGKHHHYLLSCLPGFTLVTTLGGLRVAEHISEGRQYVIRTAKTAIALLCPGFILGGIVTGFFLTDYRVDAWILGPLLGIGSLLTGILALKSRPGRVFAVSVVIVVIAAVQVHLHVMPTQDTRKYNRRFLMTLQEHLPPEALLFATGGPGIVRQIFYVQVPLIGVWYPEDIGKHLGDAKVFFVVGRMLHLEPLKQYGEVTVLSQSEKPKKGETEEERYTLFRIQRRPESFMSQN